MRTRRHASTGTPPGPSHGRTAAARRAVAIVVWLVLAAGPATATELGSPWAPWLPSITDLGARFKLLELDQPDRDLDQSSTKVNVMFDTQTGRSWVLRYTLEPGTNEPGYVWVEIPFGKAGK